MTPGIFEDSSVIEAIQFALSESKRVLCIWDKLGMTFPTYDKQPQEIRDSNIFHTLAIPYVDQYETKCWENIIHRLKSKVLIFRIFEIFKNQMIFGF